MANSASDIQREIKIKEQQSETVTSFTHIRAVVLENDSKLEGLSEIAQDTAALTERII